MLLELNDNMRIAFIQQQFNNEFPFLKLEFLENSFAKNKTVFEKSIHNNNRILGEFRFSNNILQPINIIITPEMSVQELANNFSTVYQLTTKVFRKSGNVWLNTSVTDRWTLAEQNKQGELITAQMADYKL
jgi:hypothetical protein